LELSDIENNVDSIRDMHTHGAMPDAQSIVEVWAMFVDWSENAVLVGKIGCIVAWNGKGSDMK
jgi:hypothetical protein